MRHLALAVATFGVGLAVGWLLWGRSMPPHLAAADAETTPQNRAATLQVSSREAAPTSRNPVSRPSSAAVEAAPASVDPEVATAETPGFVVLHVRVVDADGRPAHEPTVYALPAGAPGTDDDWSVARGLGAGDDLRLLLPAAGRYDVGAMDGPAHALVEGVVVPSAEALTIRLPPTALVEVDLDADAAAALARSAAQAKPGRVSSVTFAPVRAARARRWPGRGQGWSDVRRLQLDAEGRVRLLAGLLHRVEVLRGDLPDAVLGADVSEIAAPGRIHVSIVARPVDVRLRAAVPRVAKARTRIPIDLVVAGRMVASTSLFVAPGAEVSEIAWTTRLPVAAEVVQWRGAGFEPGSGRIFRSPEGRDVLEGVLVLGDALPPAEPVRSEVSVDLAAPPGTVERVKVLYTRSEVEGEWSVVGASWDDARGRGTADVPATADLVWAVGRSSDPTLQGWAHVAPARAEPGALTLVRAAYLVCVPETALPSDVLVFGVRRADGNPLALDGSWYLGSTPVSAGATIGPIEPGTHRFRVHVGGVEVGEATATVKAGEYAPLVLRLGRKESSTSR